jgi:hypothetical protein
MANEGEIGPAAGFLLFLLGVWLLVRTVAGNPSLVDILLDLGKGNNNPGLPQATPKSAVVVALNKSSQPGGGGPGILGTIGKINNLAQTVGQAAFGLGEKLGGG